MWNLVTQINLSAPAAKKPGVVSLMELIIWLGLLAVLMSISFRVMFRKKPLDQFPALTNELSNLTILAEQQAIASGNIVRLKISSVAQGGIVASVEELSQNKSSKEGKHLFLPSTVNVDTSISAQVISKQSTEAGQEQMLNETFVHFFPTGGCEEVSLLLKRNDKDKTIEFRITLNPFSCKFEQEESINEKG